jgi:D-alanyl-D-alanine dipeptidase
MITPVTRHATRSLLFFFFCLSFSSPILQSQAPARVGSPFLLGPEPADAPQDWKKMIGLFRHDTETVDILERGALYWQAKRGSGPGVAEYAITSGPGDEWHILRAVPMSQKPFPESSFSVIRAADGTAVELKMGETVYRRIDAGSDPANYYYIQLTKPLEQLRAAALAAQPPTETGPFRKPDLVELTALDPSIHLDIRYAQNNNFLSTPIYTQARAFLQRPAAEALLRVLHKLQPLSYGLLIHDGYRPWYVTKIFWDATPPADHNFVADPQKGSRHNRGCAVDLTLYDPATGKPVEMTGLYDEMSPRSFPDFPGGTSLQRWHRDLLRRAMESEGFTVNEDEWWHFDYKDWRQYPILNVPFEKLGSAAPAG